MNNPERSGYAYVRQIEEVRRARIEAENLTKSEKLKARLNVRRQAVDKLKKASAELEEVLRLFSASDPDKVDDVRKAMNFIDRIT